MKRTLSLALLSAVVPSAIAFVPPSGIVSAPNAVQDEFMTCRVNSKLNMADNDEVSSYKKKKYSKFSMCFANVRALFWRETKLSKKLLPKLLLFKVVSAIH